ncbi:Uncharacterised protein [Moraxella caviae]|uniref:Uncharacterized protein n=1 Tax=Moraxella caviae TaxID=34060 RepID=A0A378R6K2_9GAMM|nr:hypothetical protein [Moraxella caviae]STZ13683.1 Uncharacterised protein [Moraxella caviae]
MGFFVVCDVPMGVLQYMVDEYGFEIVGYGYRTGDLGEALAIDIFTVDGIVKSATECSKDGVDAICARHQIERPLYEICQ